MYRLRVEELHVPYTRHSRVGFRIWREWCFAKTVLRQFWFRIVLVPLVLVAGSLLFNWLEPEKNHGFLRGTYYTWTLVFGQSPEEFPAHPALQALFFIVPIIGVTVILQTIVELALLVRERQTTSRNWCKTMAAALKDHIVLVGMGKLGFHAYRLLRKLGEPVVVIDSNEKKSFLEDVRRDGAPLFVGDARNEQLLLDANVADARSIVIATSDDLANLEIALDARRMNPRIRVVLRMFDQALADKIRDGFDIHLSMSQSAISAPTFAMAALDRTIVNCFIVNNELVVTQRWTVNADSPLCGRTVAELLTESGVTVVELRSGPNVRLFPPAQTQLEAKQEVLVQGTYGRMLALGKHHRDAGRPEAAAGPVAV